MSGRNLGGRAAPPFGDGEDCDDGSGGDAYLIIVADAADAVSVNFSGWCKFLLI